MFSCAECPSYVLYATMSVLVPFSDNFKMDYLSNFCKKSRDYFIFIFINIDLKNKPSAITFKHAYIMLISKCFKLLRIIIRYYYVFYSKIKTN